MTIPPLRSRPGDAIELAEHFIRKYAPKGTEFRLSPELKQRLTEYHWPGNVRELENVIRRTLVMSPGSELGPEALEVTAPSPTLESSGAPQPGQTLRDVERQLFEATLASTGGNRSRTAQLLGISIRTVRNKVREYGLQRRNA
jgi:two-component system response regulator FlrC